MFFFISNSILSSVYLAIYLASLLISDSATLCSFLALSFCRFRSLGYIPAFLQCTLLHFYLTVFFRAPCNLAFLPEIILFLPFFSEFNEISFLPVICLFLYFISDSRCFFICPNTCFKIFSSVGYCGFPLKKELMILHSNPSTLTELLYNEVHKFTRAVIEKKTLCSFETNVTDAYPKWIVNGMSSFNILKHFLWDFVIYDIRIDCKRDQDVRFLPEGYHHHLQY